MKWVYFLRPVGMDGPIKIGCSQLPARRLATFMSWSPWPLEIAARIEGPSALERRFHQQFIRHHSHGEWFKPHPAITAAIDAINAGAFDTDALPAPKAIPSPNRTSPSAEKREAWSLRSRLSNLRSRCGFDEPSDVHDAAKALDGLSGAARVAAMRLIEAHIQAPHLRGRPFPYPWARPLQIAYLSKHGLATTAWRHDPATGVLTPDFDTPSDTQRSAA